MRDDVATDDWSLPTSCPISSHIHCTTTGTPHPPLIDPHPPLIDLRFR